LYLDLQPRNVLFDEWGTIHLADFDTAVSLDDQYVSDVSHRAVINYTAPELLDGAVVDQRADLYSLGATIYDMVTGHPPFGGTCEEVLAVHRADLIPLSAETVFLRGCVALATAIYDELTSKGLNPEFAERTIRIANGLDGLFSVMSHAAIRYPCRRET
jgi:serine/threonine protein kinase